MICEVFGDCRLKLGHTGEDATAALGMIEELCQRYPKTFTHEPDDVRPLARGIHKAIVADAPDLPPSIVSQALAIYAAWLPYMRACIHSAVIRCQKAASAASPFR